MDLGGTISQLMSSHMAKHQRNAPANEAAAAAAAAANQTAAAAAVAAKKPKPAPVKKSRVGAMCGARPAAVARCVQL